MRITPAAPSPQHVAAASTPSAPATPVTAPAAAAEVGDPRAVIKRVVLAAYDAISAAWVSTNAHRPHRPDTDVLDQPCITAVWLGPGIDERGRGDAAARV